MEVTTLEKCDDREGACLALLQYIVDLDLADLISESAVPSEEADEFDSLLFLLDMLASESEHLPFSKVLIASESLLHKELVLCQKRPVPAQQVPMEAVGSSGESSVAPQVIGIQPATAPAVIIDLKAKKCFEELPPELMDIIFSFLPLREKYLLLIQHRHFNRFLGKIENYASLSSKAEAVSYFRRFSRGSIVSALRGVETVSDGVSRLKPVGLKYLRKKAYWVAKIDKGILSLRQDVRLNIVEAFNNYFGDKGKYTLPDSDDSDFERPPAPEKEDESFAARPSGEFDHSQFMGLELLAKNKSLVHINLANVPLTEISWVRNLTGLKNLNLVRTKVSDLRPLSLLVNLEDLSLQGLREVQDLRPIANLVKITTLNLMETGVRSLKPLARMSRLERLDISYTEVSRIAVLAGCPRLQNLVIQRSAVTNLFPLADLTRLNSVHLLECLCLTNLAPLANLKLIEELKISGEMVYDLSPIANLTNLRYFTFLSDTSEIDLTPLGKLKRLETFELGSKGMHLANLNALSGLPKLKFLSNGSPISKADLIKRMSSTQNAEARFPGYPRQNL